MKNNLEIDKEQITCSEAWWGFHTEIDGENNNESTRSQESVQWVRNYVTWENHSEIDTI